jgi:hypothetical protein
MDHVSEPTETEPRRIRFSLRALILAAALLASAIGNVLLVWQRGRLKRKVRAYEKRLGVLHVTDRSRVHVVARPTVEDRTWRWRVWLPEDEEFFLCYGMGEIPNTDFPLRYGYSHIERGKEVDVTVALRRNIDGDWSLLVEAGGISVRPPLPDAVADMMGHACGTTQMGDRGTVRSRPGGKQLLLRRRYFKTGGARYGAFRPGFVVWLDVQRKGMRLNADGKVGE